MTHALPTTDGKDDKGMRMVETNQENHDDDDDDVPSDQVEQMEITNQEEEAMPEQDNGDDTDEDDDDKKDDDDDSSTNPAHSNDDAEDDESITNDNAALTAEQIEERFTQATTWKEQGNAAFQKGDFDPAARAYRKGVALLKPCKEQQQCTTLAVTLQTNLSMVCYKQQKYTHALNIATQALSLDPTHIKALYRRALAHRAVGNWQQAKMDLKQALQHDPTNTACHKEFKTLKQQMETNKSSQQKALAKAFAANSSSSFLYDDKEQEEQQKALEKKRLDEMQQELQKKRKLQWEDECVHRMAKNEPAISFEEWEKEQTAQHEKDEKKKRKEQDQKRREEQRQRAEARNNKDATNTDDDDDDDELTEDELKMMRGYKKTKDGRTTSYFTRELSAEEKQQNLADMAPKRLDTTPQVETAPTATATSKWNQAGTWEEKDTTLWCKTSLEQRLKETVVNDSQWDVSISKVDELTGDASVAMTGGKKRYIFDFHVKLAYEMKEVGGTDVAKGTVALPDICSGHHEEIEINFSSSWTKKPPSSLAMSAQSMQQLLAKQLRVNIQTWVQEFNAQY